MACSQGIQPCLLSVFAMFGHGMLAVSTYHYQNQPSSGVLLAAITSHANWKQNIADPGSRMPRS